MTIVNDTHRTSAPQTHDTAIPLQRGNEVNADSDAAHERACIRCGRTDGVLAPEASLGNALSCTFKDRNAWLACREKSGPHCPPWCSGDHGNEALAITGGDWLHSSEGITITLGADGGGTPETFRVALYACEPLGGPVGPADVFVDRKLDHGGYQDNLVISPRYALDLASVLIATAHLTSA